MEIPFDAEGRPIAALLMGIQGSGKSTFYRNFLQDSFIRINLDTLKTRHREALLLEECLQNRSSFAVDNTNPTPLDRDRYRLRARECGYAVIGFVLETDFDACLARNRLREGKARVPDIALYATSGKFIFPSPEEDFDALFLVHNSGAEMTLELLWEK